MVFLSTEVIEIGVAVEVLIGVADAVARARKELEDVVAAQGIVTGGVDVEAVVAVKAVPKAQTAESAKVMTRGKDVTEGRVQVVVRVHRVAEGEKRGMEAMAIEVPLYSVLKGSLSQQRI